MNGAKKEKIGYQMMTSRGWPMNASPDCNKVSVSELKS